MTHHTTRTCRTCRERHRNANDYGDPIGITPPGNPRLPWAPVAAELHRITSRPTISDRRAQQILGHHHGLIQRWRHIGVEFHTADQIAATLGYHPAGLWPEYWDVGFRVCPTIGEPDEDVAA